MISFQNFSFRYEESKDFTLRGIDMTVQTGEFILLTGRSGCGKTTLIRSLNGLIPHFYPGEIQGDLLMDGHSLLEMKPSELAGIPRPTLSILYDGYHAGTGFRLRKSRTTPRGND